MGFCCAKGEVKLADFRLEVLLLVLRMGASRGGTKWLGCLKGGLVEVDGRLCGTSLS